jgi:transcription-repair coupling factor (superfamily II helicase)
MTHATVAPPARRTTGPRSGGDAHRDAPLAPGPGTSASPKDEAPSTQPPTAAVAAALADPAREAGADGILYMASSERRADEIGRALRNLAPEVEVLVLPPWDCLPYDRASPSRESMGRRMAVLKRLLERPQAPWVLVAAAEALFQRIPPAGVFGASFREIRTGEVIRREDLEAFVYATGYVPDDRIDEPGEVALLGEVADIYPPAAEGPVRIRFDGEGRVESIDRYDPLSQRTVGSVASVVLGPASEVVLPSPDESEEPVERAAGLEHRAPDYYEQMATVFDVLAGAKLSADPKASRRCDDLLEQVAEAFEARRALGHTDAEPPPPSARLYLQPDELRAALTGHVAVALALDGVSGLANFALERNPGRAFCDAIQGALDSGGRVVLVGLSHELKSMNRAVHRGLSRAAEPIVSWREVLAAPAGSLLSFEGDIEAGFKDSSAGITVIAASDVLGGRVARRPGSAPTLTLDPDLRVGDVVIHEDHGIGVIRSLELVEVDGAARDAVRLEYHGGTSLLVPAEDFGRIWRYGAEEAAVTLDRLHTDAWAKRRVELSVEIDRAAAELIALAKARAEQAGPVLAPPRAAYARFAARFPYPETQDQAAAIAAVLADLASGRMMNRLVCGDVGFGKTEVALRAAAAAALCGRQVAIVAPTTVLARQHFQVFQRRFAGTGVTVAQLSRLVDTAEARKVKAGLADGSIGVVVGTHALAARDIAFADLALLIVDEEQRFGARMKRDLRAMGEAAHVLTMTATPIPRTLQMAMVGIEDVSVIATPPARRRPIRTFLAPFDGATVRTALLREARRGGQSFIVAPRIEDIGPLTDQLAKLAPELTVRIAHGRLAPEEVDAVMVGFAEGDGDILLATNIIESGLDVPRANTMLIWRPDRFGLAQLHQLRGRVGRGRAQGLAYLLGDPDEEMPEATRARLSTLEAFDRLGSGLEISARDLDLRGAGDLIGEAQAGHVKMIGADLYQRLLTRAVRVARGEEEIGDTQVTLNVGVTGALPEAYVPESAVRISLYVRLARIADIDEVDALADELEDRFGHRPPEVEILLALARVRALAARARIARIDAGPKAIALTPHSPAAIETLMSAERAVARDGRAIFETRVAEPSERLKEIQRLLQSVAG